MSHLAKVFKCMCVMNILTLCQKWEVSFIGYKVAVSPVRFSY